MIAVTVATEDFMDLANEQASWMRRHSGLQTFVISTKDGYREKLELQRHFPGKKVLFFDADYRLIRPVNIAEIYKDGSFTGVIDPGVFDKDMFPHNDCQHLRIDKKKYINTGLWIADFGRQEQVNAFNMARQMLEEKRNGIWEGIGDQGEQSFLNAAMQRVCPDNIKLIGQEWNFYPMSWSYGCLPNIPRWAIGVHAAGYAASEKSNALNAMQTLLTLPCRPTIEEAEGFFSKVQ